MLHVVCVNAGNYQGRGAQYVNILHDSVQRNLKEGFEGDFTCFTDNPGGLDRGIIARALPHGLNGWWNKLFVFAPNLFSNGDRVLYFDLDTVITGRLDELAAYDGPFAILRDWLEPEIVNSSVMAWPAGWGTHLWTSFEANDRPDMLGGDQEWIRRNTVRPVRLQDEFPDTFVSYKRNGGKIPDKASVCCFHGTPRPHEVKGWVSEVWCKNGLVRAQLDKICNTEREKLQANISSACGRNLDWLDLVPAHDGHAVIIGGGPSLDDCEELIRWRQSQGQTVWALNGSGAWLRARGLLPDFHVIADARPDNAQFVKRTDSETTYLIASQCDPAVFNALAGCKVTLWHADGSDVPRDQTTKKDKSGRPVHYIGMGSTVGLLAMVLAFAKGYRKIHLYGFDSSYREDTHHAYMQNLNDGDLVIDVLAGDRRFRAATWMAQQAEEFCVLATQLANDGAVITVSGDGLLPHLARQIEARKPNEAELRAHEILSRLPEGEVAGAEIGVFAGELSRLLLDRPGLKLVMVDSWAGDGKDYLGDSGDWHARLSDDKQQAYRAKAENAVKQFNGQASIVALPSHIAVEKVQDASLDFVFIDADHSYEGCKRDLHLWSRKLKPNGLLSGHDYNNTAFENFGVTRAVDEFVSAHGMKLELGANFTWFARTA